MRGRFWAILACGLLGTGGMAAAGDDALSRNDGLTRMVLLQRRRALADTLFQSLQDPDLGVRQIALSNLDIAGDDPRLIPALLQQLRSPPSLRWLAVREIAWIPTAFVTLRSEVAGLATDPDPYVRRALLANIEPGPGVNEMARPLLQTALMGPDAGDLMAAARTWARLKLPVPDATVEKLAGELEEADEVRAGAASYALSALWNDRIENRVQELTRIGPWMQRVRAADLLRKRGVALDPSLYSGIFSAGDEVSQLYACGTLSRLPRADTADLLREAGASRFHSVRQAAVYTLEAIGSEAARKVLLELSRASADANVRYRTAIVLGRMERGTSGLSAGFPPRDGPAPPSGASSLKVAEAHGSLTPVKDGIVQVGTQKQLLVDDFSLESLGGAVRAFHKFTKDPRNPVLEQQYPGEVTGLKVAFAPSLDYDPEARLLRMYYYGKSTAVSHDGVHWIHQPNMGSIPDEGSKDGVTYGGWPAHNIVRLHHPYDGRYRFAAYTATAAEVQYDNGFPMAAPYSIIVSFSRNGLADWTKPEKVATQGSDYFSMAREDISGGYLGFTKWQASWWMGQSFGENHGFLMKAALKTVTGSRRSFAALYGPRPDMLHRGRLNIYPLEGDDQAAPGYVAANFAGPDSFAAEEMHSEVYAITSFPYEGIYFLIPSVFYVSGPGKTNDDGLIRLSLMFSRDKTGRSGWSRNGPNGFEPILDLGHWGEWDSVRTYGGSNTIMVANDEIVLYYTGFNFGHNPMEPEGATGHDFRCAIGRATMRLDGLASLHAGDEEAAILTKPLTFHGNRLLVNVTGGIQAEILGAGGRPVTGFERGRCAAFSGDAIRHELTWAGANLGSLAGRTVRLRFYLRNGDLYSYAFATSSPSAFPPLAK